MDLNLRPPCVVDLPQATRLPVRAASIITKFRLRSEECALRTVINTTLPTGVTPQAVIPGLAPANVAT